MNENTPVEVFAFDLKCRDFGKDILEYASKISTTEFSIIDKNSMERALQYAMFRLIDVANLLDMEVM